MAGKRNLLEKDMISAIKEKRKRRKKRRKNVARGGDASVEGESSVERAKVRGRRRGDRGVDDIKGGEQA